MDKSPDNSQTLIKIHVKINNLKCLAIIDTGSTISLVHPSVITKLNEDLTIKEGTRVRLLDQSYAELKKIAHLEIELDEEIYLHDFYIYDKLRFDVLLGIDFCRKTNIVLNFDKEYDIKLPSAEIIDKNMNSQVRLKKEYDIAPKSLIKLDCQLEFDIGLGYFKPDKRMKEEFFVEFQESVIETTSTCEIFVYNPRPISVFLFNNLKIGTIYMIKNE